MTKLDVLGEFDEIKVCVAYECEGKKYDYFPMQQSVLFHAKPIYEVLPGWKGQDISGCKAFDELPKNAQAYVNYLQKQIGVKFKYISTGPDRNDTIIN